MWLLAFIYLIYYLEADNRAIIEILRGMSGFCELVMLVLC